MCIAAFTSVLELEYRRIRKNWSISVSRYWSLFRCGCRWRWKHATTTRKHASCSASCLQQSGPVCFLFSGVERMCALLNNNDNNLNIHNSFDNQSFSVVGPHVWNNLPTYLRHDVNYGQFKWQLKTFLFES